ncbi:MAG: hypothetical protein ACNA8K_09255 [Cyclonatronaceae bacterium]
MSIKISVGNKQNRSITAALAGGLICGALAAFGFYVALWDPSVSGGIHFMPDGANQALGRIVFGAGSVVTTLIGLYAFREAYMLYRERRSGS